MVVVVVGRPDQLKLSKKKLQQKNKIWKANLSTKKNIQKRRKKMIKEENGAPPSLKLNSTFSKSKMSITRENQWDNEKGYNDYSLL